MKPSRIFSSVQVFHCVSFLSFPPDSATGSSRHITASEVEALSLRRVAASLDCYSCSLEKGVRYESCQIYSSDVEAAVIAAAWRA